MHYFAFMFFADHGLSGQKRLCGPHNTCRSYR